VRSAPHGTTPSVMPRAEHASCPPQFLSGRGIYRAEYPLLAAHVPSDVGYPLRWTQTQQRVSSRFLLAVARLAK
jgi:hypothetical protein